ncbi:MAG: response regulator transcription factor [Anaerolineae bacterium]|jgi:DNA-binding NarL/FixJ family response regulator
MRPIRVLIVDDMPHVRQGLRTLLPLAGQAAGLQLELVGEAGNGNEAIAQAIALGPDVVLMDLEMPEMDGYAATQAIKAVRPSTRVIALTVHGDPAARHQAQEAGVDQFVEKGTPLPVLMQAIRSGVEKSKS